MVGAIGRVDQQLRERLVSAFPDHHEHDLDTDAAMLLSRGATHTWRSGQEHGVLWSPTADPTAVTRSDEATHDAVSPHLSIGRHEISINSSAWGLQPVYVHQQGPCLLFATTSTALIDLIDGPLEADWDAWAAIMMLGYPVGGRSLFTGIDRLQECEGRQLDRRSGAFRTIRSIPRAIGRATQAKPDEVVEALRHALVTSPALGLAAPDDGYLASLPLTGGYDSRLLAALAVDAFGPDAFCCLTSSVHRSGADPDVTFGTMVGDRFGVTQHVLSPDASAYPAYAKRMFDLLEHESAEHGWYEPVASVLHGWGAPVIDGLAGDVLMKNSYVAENLFVITDRDQLRQALWVNMNRHPYLKLPGVTRAMRDEMTERISADLDPVFERYEGTEHTARLFAMATRTQRGVAISPHKALAAAVEPVTPFLHPDVTSALLSIPWTARSDDALARGLLDIASPGLSSLPSTNDPGARPASGRRRSSSPESYAWALSRFDLLNQFIGQGFSPEDVATMHRDFGDRWRLRLILLADWLETYQSRLKSTTPPWWTA